MMALECNIYIIICVHMPWKCPGFVYPCKMFCYENILKMSWEFTNSTPVILEIVVNMVWKSYIVFFL